ncbi:MAG: hypothetical protein MZV63_65745 [Marinilabiliales bacterium]|nr:hypothetical protein [Marinilabiliales bacterium]
MVLEPGERLGRRIVDRGHFHQPGYEDRLDDLGLAGPFLDGQLGPHESAGAGLKRGRDPDADEELAA